MDGEVAGRLPLFGAAGGSWRRRLNEYLCNQMDCGVVPGMPQSEARALRFMNIWAFCTFFIYPFYVYFGIHIKSPVFVAASITTAVSHIATMHLVKTGRHMAARRIFFLFPSAYIVFATFYLPPKIFAPLYHVVILFAAFVDCPPREWKLLASSVSFSATCLLGSFILMNRVGHSIVLSPEDLEFARTASIFGVMVGLILLGATARYAIRQSEGEAERARRKVDDLLENTLPAGIVNRLKKQPGSVAGEFEEVTIMFADIVDFTPMAARMNPEELVEFLNRTFTIMDNIAGRHGLEKIKTIGDAYMAAAGIPEPREDHASAVAEMALELVDAFDGVKAPDGSPVLLRIGINTGPVAAGVIGRRKFAYDLWGNTVNTASRMESYGESGRIQVTEEVFKRLQGSYVFEYRGETPIKGKGMMKTWFLQGRAAA